MKTRVFDGKNVNVDLAIEESSVFEEEREGSRFSCRSCPKRELMSF